MIISDWKRRRLMLLAALIGSAKSLHADFSFKDMVSWVSGQKQDSFYEKYPFDQAGSIVIENKYGAIKIKTWDHPQLVIKALKSASSKDLAHLELQITIDQDRATITTLTTREGAKGTIDISLIVPRNTDITATCSHGALKSKNADGALDLTTTTGPIIIKHSKKNITARSEDGSITAIIKTLTPATPLDFLAGGEITLTLPKNASVDLDLQALQGSITCDIPVTLKSKKMKLQEATWNRYKKECCATLATGGAPITLVSTKGSIKISQ